MESRELRDLMKKISATPNVFNTIFYSRQLNGYLEQHKILEIVSELMVLLALHRPPDVTTFMAENLPIIAENYRNNFVCLTFSNFLEQSNTIHRYAKLFKSPVIELKSSDKALDKLAELNDFLRRNSISGKNVILCSVLGEVCGRNFKALGQSKPIEISVPAEIDHKFLYYIHQNVMNSKRETLIKGWPVRLLIVGRDGSGRKFQAAQVAKEKGLIMLDLDYEFIKYLQSGKMYPFPFHLFKRISKHEFQHNGWICVAHPAMIQDLQCLFENLAEQPTKVLFIHTSQKACLRRIDGAIKRHFCHLGDDGNFTVEHLARQMHLYDLHKKEFVEYFRGRRPIVPILHIDGNQARRKITTLILASI